MDNLVDEIDRMADEMKRQAGEKQVWAFIATYDKNGNLDWKAYDEDWNMLGSELVRFDSVRDEE